MNPGEAEYRVEYYEPGLGWCTLHDPHPEGTIYHTLDVAIAAGERLQERFAPRDVRVWQCGAHGSHLVYEKSAPKEGGR